MDEASGLHLSDLELQVVLDQGLQLALPFVHLDHLGS